MVHLSSLAYVQLVLVEIGLVLHLIAYRYSHMETSGHRTLSDNGKREDKGHEDNHASKPAHSEPAHKAVNRVEVSNPSRAKRLLRTSKVNFVQTFKFREYDPHRQ